MTDREPRFWRLTSSPWSPEMSNHDVPTGAFCGVLTPEQQRVLREHGTEPPRSSPLDKEYREGIYRCVGCETPLFESTTKFNSGTGWPSFFSPLSGAVGTSFDESYGMRRTEVHCGTCKGHLGHVFTARHQPGCATASTAWCCASNPQCHPQRPRPKFLT